MKNSLQALTKIKLVNNWKIFNDFVKLKINTPHVDLSILNTW